MRLYIISEPLFRQSPWYNVIYSSLVGELSRKKYSYTFLEENSPRESDNLPCFAFILGSHISWLSEKIKECEIIKAHPIILSTRDNDGLCGAYSLVTSNLSASMDFLIKHLRSHDKTKTALYGVNRMSAANMVQKQCFEENSLVNCTVYDIYYNDGSIEECAERLLEKIDSYDSVISVNDFATVTLLRRLTRIENPPTVVSFGETKLVKKFFPSILTVSLGYEDFGKAAVSIVDSLCREPFADSITISVKCKMNGAYFDDSCRSVTDSSRHNVDFRDSHFYSDRVMNDMLKLENMLLDCDETDFEILSMLCEGLSYEQISEKLYCAENTVKYRVKKMKQSLGCASRQEIVRIVKECCDI